jgi:hypothetical protein
MQALWKCLKAKGLCAPLRKAVLHFAARAINSRCVEQFHDTMREKDESYCWQCDVCTHWDVLRQTITTRYAVWDEKIFYLRIQL